MAIEEANRPRRATRARGNSVVQKIALHVPQSENHMHIGSKSPAPIKRSKSHIYLQIIDSIKDHQQSLFPFTEEEKQQWLDEYTDLFNYKILPPIEQQKAQNKQRNLKYQRFLDACNFRQQTYENLIDRSTVIIQDLKDLTVKYDTVIKETSEFQAQSDALIAEQTKYENLNQEIQDYLHYYELLDTFTRKLNNPSPNIVRKESFRRMLKQLDECLSFVEANPDHKDYAQFQRRFKQCLIRSLTLIRNYIINNLKTIRDNISSKVSGTKVNSVTQEAILYTRFGTDAEFLKDVSTELCERAQDNEEYAGLLNDCFNFYFGIRNKLLQTKIWDHIQSLNIDKHKTLAQFSQYHIGFFTKVFRDEHDLFFRIFSRDHNHAMTNWFQNLAEPLYDTIRNRVLREQSILPLCETATLLAKYYEYDESEEPFDHRIEENVNVHDFNKDVDLGTIFQPIKEDVQSRLVFRAQVYAEDNIVKYRPSAKDFQIGHRKSSSHEGETSDKQELDDDTALVTNKAGVSNWYPPLNKGVALLSKIYQMVSSSVFDDLVHNIVHDCIISVREAYRVSKETLGPLDSDLFFLKNLLMLKEQIQQFDIEYVSSETFLDFSGIGDIIEKIKTGSSVIGGSGLLQLVRDSVPKVVSNMVDARVELQTELRNIVHQFTEDAVNNIIEPLSNPNPETANEDINRFKENAEASFPRIKDEIDTFIEDHQTVTTLIDGIQDVVIQKYETYYNTIINSLKDDTEVIEVDTLIEFIGQLVSKLFETTDLEKDVQGLEPNISE